MVAAKPAATSMAAYGDMCRVSPPGFGRSEVRSKTLDRIGRNGHELYT